MGCNPSLPPSYLFRVTIDVSSKKRCRPVEQRVRTIAVNSRCDRSWTVTSWQVCCSCTAHLQRTVYLARLVILLYQLLQHDMLQPLGGQNVACRTAAKKILLLMMMMMMITLIIISHSNMLSMECYMWWQKIYSQQLLLPCLIHLKKL